MGKLDGKVAIVTGATNGMGRDTAYVFAQEGAKVVVTGRNEERAKEVVEKIKAAGGEASYVIADVSDTNAPKVIFDETMKTYGTVDVLVNNAGVTSRMPIETLDVEEINRVMNVNYVSPFLLSQLCLKVMQEKGKGSIVNISSIAGITAHNSTGSCVYGPSKAAMNSMTQVMALHQGPNVRVNAICPGAIHTSMVDNALAHGLASVVEGMKNNSPLKRLGTGYDIAHTAVFLACDDSAYITGQMIRVDGGCDL